MQILLAFVIGGLYAASIYMMLRRSIVKLIMGLALLGYASHLLIFTIGGLVREPALIPADASVPIPPFADPLPQAMILTAIVISFGTLAFTIVLIRRVYQIVGTDDIDSITTTDR